MVSKIKACVYAMTGLTFFQFCLFALAFVTGSSVFTAVAAGFIICGGLTAFVLLKTADKSPGILEKTPALAIQKPAPTVAEWADDDAVAAHNSSKASPEPEPEGGNVNV